MSNGKLYIGSVMHRRLFPVKYKFIYRVFSLLINIDTLEQDLAPLKFLSLEKFNLFTFSKSDHGPRDGSDLRDWVDCKLAEAGLLNAGHRVELFCFPRVLGYTFNPLSLWLCYDQKNTIKAILAQVHNTFGEQHIYLLKAKNMGPLHAQHKKTFHVSPFIDMNAQYDFSIDANEEQIKILIKETKENKLLLVASQIAQRRELSDACLLSVFFSIPLMTIKIITAIHWQAFKLWLRGLKFFAKPPQPTDEMSL